MSVIERVLERECSGKKTITFIYGSSNSIVTENVVINVKFKKKNYRIVILSIFFK